MARSRTLMTFQLSADQAYAVCLAATIKLGWSLSCGGRRRLTAQEIATDASSAVHPVRVAICIESISDDTSEIVVNGANFGSGQLSIAHVRERVGRLSRAIEKSALRAVRACMEPSPTAIHNVSINGIRLADVVISALQCEYGTAISNGDYWYDPVCGAWGLDGGPTCGFIQPGLGLGGPLRADASRGTSGVLINGRELGKPDLEALWRLVGIVPGRYWLNACGELGRQPGPRIASLLTMPCSYPAAAQPEFIGVAAPARVPAGKPKNRHVTVSGVPSHEEPIPF